MDDYDEEEYRRRIIKSINKTNKEIVLMSLYFYSIPLYKQFAEYRV